MGAHEVNPTGRLSDPSITSVIFAPRPQNYTLSCVSAKDDPLEALGLEFWMNPEEIRAQSLLASLRWTKLERMISDCLTDFFRGTLSQVAIALPGEVVITGPRIIPERTFPFASHLDLLGETIEGVFINPDDYVNH